MSVAIAAVHMSAGGHLHEHIEEVKWTQASPSESGRAKVSTVVNWIDNQKVSVISTDGTTSAPVGTVHPSGRPAYIRSHQDRVPTDNLLHLPRY